MTYLPPLWVTESCVLAVWIAAVLFAVVYTLKAPWWVTQMGRNLFAFDVAVAMAMTPEFLKYACGMDPETEFFQWLIISDLILVALLVAHRLRLLLQVQAGWNWQPARRIAAAAGGLYARLRGRKR